MILRSYCASFYMFDKTSNYYQICTHKNYEVAKTENCGSIVGLLRWNQLHKHNPPKKARQFMKFEMIAEKVLGQDRITASTNTR